MNKLKIMKNISIISMMIFILAITSCQKENTGNGNMLASVIHDGKPMPKATLYLKYNSSASTQSFDKRAITDVYGDVYFNDLTPGTYHLYCKGYDYEGKHYAEGFANVKIRQRFRQNEERTQIETFKY